MPQVRLVGANGEQVGIVTIAEALKAAQDAKLDLVEIAPQADPVVCKILRAFFNGSIFVRFSKAADYNKNPPKVSIKRDPFLQHFQPGVQKTRRQTWCQDHLRSSRARHKRPRALPAPQVPSPQGSCASNP